MITKIISEHKKGNSIIHYVAINKLMWNHGIKLRKRGTYMFLHDSKKVHITVFFCAYLISIKLGEGIGICHYVIRAYKRFRLISMIMFVSGIKASYNTAPPTPWSSS